MEDQCYPQNDFLGDLYLKNDFGHIHREIHLLYLALTDKYPIQQNPGLEYTPLPKHLEDIFASLDKITFSSEQELMTKLKNDSDVICFSVTKKVYDLGTFHLLQNKTTESEFRITTRDNACQIRKYLLARSAFPVIKDKTQADWE